jgi:hypothetical protein
LNVLSTCTRAIHPRHASLAGPNAVAAEKMVSVINLYGRSIERLELTVGGALPVSPW